MPGYLLETVVGFIVWLLANVVYLDMVRGGRRGFRRLLAFWFGIPTTFLTLVFVRKDVQVRIEPPPDDEDALLAEIRRDRWLRAGGSRGDTEHEPDTDTDTDIDTVDRPGPHPTGDTP